MKLKRYTCIVLIGALLTVTQASAAPTFTSFLSVDINGYNADGGQVKGPTEPGFQDFEAGQGFFVPAPVRWDNSGAAGLTNDFATTQGNIKVNMRGIAPASSLFARNRGANAGGLPALHQDFASAQRGLNGFGQNYIRLGILGLIPNQYYEFTGFSREPVFTSPTDHVGDAQLASYAAWTDIDRLGGVDGPGPWMNANVGANAVYQPIYTDHDNNPATPDQPTGYKNPIPTSVRSPVSGPDTLSAANIYNHSATFITKSDATGNIVVYNWSDPNGYGSTSQGATLLNGFKLGLIPLAGDYSNDAKVDAADYVLWRKNPGALGGNPAGYIAWRSNFGQTSGSGSGADANATVPEPATMVMLIVTAAGLCSRRGRAA